MWRGAERFEISVTRLMESIGLAREKSARSMEFH